SSRRRHTRWPRDWSSDVCSSDLQHVGGHRVQFDAGVFQGLVDALFLGRVGLDEALAVAGEVPQLPDDRWRHEAAPQQPVFEQLEIGRASCRERGEMWGRAVWMKG